MGAYSVYISVLSLIVSIIVLYLTQLQKPNISFHLGSTLGFCHLEGGFELYTPITFLNTAQRTGLVRKCAVLVSFPNYPTRSHYIEWTEFSDYDAEKREWFRAEFAGPLPVPGRASENRMVRFKWHQGDVAFAAGVYHITFYVWLRGSRRPEITSSHTGELSEQNAADLSQFKAENKSRIRYFTVDEEIESNKLLTSHEVSTLLGDNHVR